MKRCCKDPSCDPIGDPALSVYREAWQRRRRHAEAVERRLTNGRPLETVAAGHAYFGLHRTGREWRLREWAPHASRVLLVGDCTDWRRERGQAFERIEPRGIWELRLPAERLDHGALYRLHVEWPGGEGDRIPSYAMRVVQDPHTQIFNAQVWDPQPAYAWRHAAPPRPDVPLIYETHVGMAQEEPRIGQYAEFAERVLPRIRAAGYNTVQLMAVMEHPYYASFGYQVSNFFAPSSRFGTPDDLKALIDEAHAQGLRVVMDLVHSHAVNNEVEGLARFDGSRWQYFHDGPRGRHPVWDSRCFDYGKPEVLHFLLSNCRFWLEEYRFDGFRFDGVTSMLYLHHGLGKTFASYADYFDGTVDEDAWAYLALANKLIHRLRPTAVTIAEDVSGIPGLGVPVEDGGAGFDCRLAMGVPDCWFKLLSEVPDEQWDLGYLWRELTNRRREERSISYVESHDQALVGGKTLIFQMMDADMYVAMRCGDESLAVDRGMALHKLTRLTTLATAGHGYLNFMGNEFGHPEWIDFPREGNGWSFGHARRQWSLCDDPALRFRFLGEFDRTMLHALAPQMRCADDLPKLLHIDDQARILAFARERMFLVLNFHPSRAVTDYPLEVLPGEYEHEFDTDEPRFGGQGRIARDQRYYTLPRADGNALRHCLQVYLPPRVGLVLRRLRKPKTNAGDPDGRAPE